MTTIACREPQCQRRHTQPDRTRDQLRSILATTGWRVIQDLDYCPGHAYWRLQEPQPEETPA